MTESSISRIRAKAAPFTLGTAQLGLPAYGRVNRTGRPTEEQARVILSTAIASGVCRFDTARAYGDSEAVLGKLLPSNRDGLQVITKLSPLAHLTNTSSPEEIDSSVDASIRESLHSLKQESLDVLMLHRWEHFTAFDGRIWTRIAYWHRRGQIRQLGASLYTPAEAEAALKIPEITHLQIPYNLLDHRWRTETFLKARSKRPDVVIYGRSGYLQGVLLAKPGDWPQRAGFDPVEMVRRLELLCHRLARESLADLCLAYLLASPLVDSVVMGVETLAQLEANLELARRPALTQRESEMVERTVADAPGWLLDPSQWN